MVIKTNFNLTEYNSYRINASCAKAIFPEKEEDIIAIYEENGPKIVLGSGYNIILSKPHYEETFVIFDSHFSSFQRYDNLINAQSGISMLTLSEMAYSNSLSGLEIFYDIPSSLGGAIVMNAGAGGEDIKNLLVKVKYFDPYKLQFFERGTEEIDFTYRNSFFQKNPHLIIIEALLRLNPGNGVTILNKMNETKAARWAKQPRDFPNGGSVFKRPPNKYVGVMIEELGLKGYAIGGAKVSEKHGGFIINYKDATGSDIVNLIHEIKKQVLNVYDIDLEIEQRII